MLVYIAKRIVELLDPKWLRIGAYWYPRGGIPIDVSGRTGEPPKGVWLPEQGVATYRAAADADRSRWSLPIAALVSV